MKNKWFHQSPVWLIILLPLAAVIAGITTVIIAHDNKVDLVAEDYYKTGKAINADLSKLQTALDANITLHVSLQNEQGEIAFASGGENHQGALKLNLYHPTLAKQDISVMLTADSNGVYRFDLPKAVDGKWSVRVEPFDGSWRVQEDIVFPAQKALLDGKQ